LHRSRIMKFKKLNGPDHETCHSEAVGRRVYQVAFATNLEDSSL
jgi:hypothetical protein